jgi:hypothetical protein
MVFMVRLHGNWCGPNWTDGKAQPANAAGVNFKGKCIDQLDCACRAHDKDCANDLGCSKAADSKLILEALKIVANPIHRIFNPGMVDAATLVIPAISAARVTRKR